MQRFTCSAQVKIKNPILSTITDEEMYKEYNAVNINMARIGFIDYLNRNDNVIEFKNVLINLSDKYV